MNALYTSSGGRTLPALVQRLAADGAAHLLVTDCGRSVLYGFVPRDPAGARPHSWRPAETAPAAPEAAEVAA